MQFHYLCSLFVPTSMQRQGEGLSYLSETRSRSRDPKGGLATKTSAILEEVHSPDSQEQQETQGAHHYDKDQQQQQRQQQQQQGHPRTASIHGSGGEGGARSLSPPSVEGSSSWRRQRMDVARAGSSFHRTESFGDNNRSNFRGAPTSKLMHQHN